MKHQYHGSKTGDSNVAMFALMLMCCFAAIAYFLFFSKSLDFNSVWLILILLACPLVHLFMHHRHGGN
jgi:hypothetical protein